MLKYLRHNDGLPWLTFGRFFATDDKGGGTGGGGNNNDGKGGSEGGGADNGGGNSDDSDSDDDDNSDSEDEDDKPVYSKKKMTDIVSKRLNDARTKWERDAQKAKDTENNNFKGLYETTHKELEELKPKAELADNLVELTNNNIDDEIKDWPEEIKDMDPGKEDVKARLAWLPKGRKAVKKFEETQQSKGINGEHGKKGQGQGQAIDKALNSITNPERYAIPGQKTK